MATISFVDDISATVNQTQVDTHTEDKPEPQAKQKELKA